MPRIPHSLLLRAYNISPLLPLILRATRTLPSAIRELRWLDEHVKQELKYPGQSASIQRWKLVELCKRRERGEPLQYILGSQPFGDLDIKCRPGVLIPRLIGLMHHVNWTDDMFRPETEAYTTYLAELLLEGRLHADLKPQNFDKLSPDKKSRGGDRPLKIMDVCSGSGCISLLLYSLLAKRIPNIKICGYDISGTAQRLSLHNLQDAENNHFHHASRIEFRKIDILAEPKERLWMDPQSKNVDIIISNPPYISHKEFYKSTARSVRNFEPKLALVPEGREHGHDLVFFRRLLLLHGYFESRILVMEASGEEQCLEIAREARQMFGERQTIEIWKDWPGQEPAPHKAGVVSDRNSKDEFTVRGSGHYRSVVLFRLPETSIDTSTNMIRL